MINGCQVINSKPVLKLIEYVIVVSPPLFTRQTLTQQSKCQTRSKPEQFGSTPTIPCTINYRLVGLRSRESGASLEKRRLITTCKQRRSVSGLVALCFRNYNVREDKAQSWRGFWILANGLGYAIMFSVLRF